MKRKKKMINCIGLKSHCLRYLSLKRLSRHSVRERYDGCGENDHKRILCKLSLVNIHEGDNTLPKLTYG